MLKQGWSAFDVDGKGYINADDLRRVCRQMGYKVSDRDVRNMIHVMSPTAAIAEEGGAAQGRGDATKGNSAPSKCEGHGGENAAALFREPGKES